MVEGIDWAIVLWLVLGVLSGVGELLTGSLFLLPFAIGAFVTAGFVVAGADPAWAIFVFLAVTLLAMALVVRFGRRAQDAPPATREGANRYRDARGVVTLDITSQEAGRVRVGAELWRAVSSSGEPIPIDTAVRVIEIRGNALVVDPE